MEHPADRAEAADVDQYFLSSLKNISCGPCLRTQTGDCFVMRPRSPSKEAQYKWLCYSYSYSYSCAVRRTRCHWSRVCRQTSISFRCEMRRNWISESHLGAIKDSLTAWPGQNDWNRQHYGAIRTATNLVSFAFRSRMNYRSEETMRSASMRSRLNSECTSAVEHGQSRVATHYTDAASVAHVFVWSANLSSFVTTADILSVQR